MGTLIASVMRYKASIAASLAVFAVAGIAEYGMGRSVFGPSGMPHLYTSDVYTSEQSQTFFDVYSLSHIIHGMLFYGLLVLCVPWIPLRWRLVLALIIEAAWEILENSPIIINRYRAVTIAWGYVGDSIFNSLSDILMAALGFLYANRVKFWVVVATIVIFELVALYWVRDNLTLNIIMLVHPLDVIKNWQLEAVPH